MNNFKVTHQGLVVLPIHKSLSETKACIERNKNRLKDRFSLLTVEKTTLKPILEKRSVVMHGRYNGLRQIFKKTYQPVKKEIVCHVHLK